MSMEFEEKDDGKVLKEREKDKERGREKRKDGKRRKGSLIRIAGGSEESSAAGPSSIESSPASLRAVPTIFQSSPIANDATPPTPRSPSPTPANPQPSPLVERQINANRLLPPLPIIISQQASPRPWEIPLPDSPAAGPSRLSSAEAEDVSVNGDDASDSALSNEPDSKQIGRSNGFSIIPEEGYLPVVPVTTSTKKKRRKAKAVSPFLARSLSAGPTDTSHTEFSSRHASPAGRSPLEPSSRHARKASLSRPPNADLEDLLDERDRLIDSLRAEIGRAKAEEGKARESVRIAQANEERTSRDVDQMRRTSHKTESESRRRHREVSAFAFSALLC